MTRIGEDVPANAVAPLEPLPDVAAAPIPAPAELPPAAGPLRRALETSPFPLLLICVVGICSSRLRPRDRRRDSWLTLMAGREVVQNGLPDTETITIFGHGSTWTNQQWLAQVVFYGADWIGGIKAVVFLDIVLVLLTLSLGMATARATGATARSTFLVALLSIVAGPWGWTIRAQAAALPLFAATLWLLVDGSRHGIRRRTLLVLPLLVVWANLHGSVILGAASRRRPRGDRAARAAGCVGPLVLVVFAPLCILASPYVTKLPAYYKLMLVDAPFSATLREWQWSKPSGTTFFSLASSPSPSSSPASLAATADAYELSSWS